MRKTLYSPALEIDGTTYKIPKTYLCDMANANACHRRAAWYGIHKIGPRVYAVYRCAIHGIFNRRINGSGYGAL